MDQLSPAALTGFYFHDLVDSYDDGLEDAAAMTTGHSTQSYLVGRQNALAALGLG